MLFTRLQRPVFKFHFTSWNRGLMSLVDSTAVFETRARAIVLNDQVITAMGLRGWTTHGTYAFSVATQPGADEQAFSDGVIVPLLVNPDHPDAPKLRRLFFESHTLTSAELRRKVDSTEQEAPRKLPAPERIEMLQARIEPLIVAKHLEPSHQLINSLMQCVEDGRVRYIEWSKCTSRTQQVNNVKEDPDLRRYGRQTVQVQSGLRQRSLQWWQCSIRSLMSITLCDVVEWRMKSPKR